jgi:carbonic anhydrase
MKGNDRYVEGRMKRHDFIAERPALALGQNPFAGILGCADSRAQNGNLGVWRRTRVSPRDV